MIFEKSAPQSHNTKNLELSMFLQDISSFYSIDLIARTDPKSFYKIIPSENDSMLKYAQDGGTLSFLRYQLNEFLSNITHEIVIKGEAFAVLEEDIKNNTLQNWNFRIIPWQSFKKGKNTLNIKHVVNHITRNETLDNQKVIHFSFQEIGLSSGVFRKAMKRIERSSLQYRPILTSLTNNDYDFILHKNVSSFEFLSATRLVYWNGRSYSNKYTSEPYILYKRGRWLQLRLKILKYLIEKTNQFLNEYGKQYGLYGEIQYDSCFSSEQITNLWQQYSLGKISTAVLRDYLFQ